MLVIPNALLTETPERHLAETYRDLMRAVQRVILNLPGWDGAQSRDPESPASPLLRAYDFEPTGTTYLSRGESPDPPRRARLSREYPGRKARPLMDSTDVLKRRHGGSKGAEGLPVQSSKLRGQAITPPIKQDDILGQLALALLKI